MNLDLEPPVAAIVKPWEAHCGPYARRCPHTRRSPHVSRPPLPNFARISSALMAAQHIRFIWSEVELIVYLFAAIDYGTEEIRYIMV